MEVREVLSRDCFPSIDEPEFTIEKDRIPGNRLVVIDPDDEPARGYPTQVLNYHEIVNDNLDGGPIAVTWCPLCGSAVVFERRVDGRELTFGVSGKLADDNLILYDRETESEWKQLTGECIGGKLEGERLPVRTSTVMTRGQFLEVHPDGVFLDPPGGETTMFVDTGDGKEPVQREIDYSVNNYEEYFQSDHIGTQSREEPREWNRDDIGAKEVVLGILRAGDALAVPQPSVGSDDVVNVTVGGTDIVVFSDGEELQAYVNPGFEFTPAGDGQFRADGTTWKGTNGQSTDGRTLERAQTKRTFAFAWQNDYGLESFYFPD